MQPERKHPATPGENNYIMYEIKDKKGSVLGQIIATWHTVKPQDKSLNSKIRGAVAHADQAFFEIPPKCREGLSHRKFVEIIIDEFEPKEIELASEDNLESFERQIQEKASPETYRIIQAKAANLTGRDKLKFMKLISLFSEQLDDVSLDDFLAHHFLLTHENGTIEPLENRDVIQEARALSAEIPQAFDLPIPQDPKENLSPDLEGLDLARMKKTDLPKDGYTAWRDGDIEALKENYRQNRPPAVFIVHNEIRNREIAEKIAKTVKILKDGGETLPLFVMGAAHLLDPHMKTVLSYLHEKLPGCTIEPYKQK